MHKLKRSTRIGNKPMDLDVSLGPGDRGKS